MLYNFVEMAGAGEIKGRFFFKSLNVIDLLGLYFDMRVRLVSPHNPQYIAVTTDGHSVYLVFADFKKSTVFVTAGHLK